MKEEHRLHQELETDLSVIACYEVSLWTGVEEETPVLYSALNAKNETMFKGRANDPYEAIRDLQLLMNIEKVFMYKDKSNTGNEIYIKHSKNYTKGYPTIEQIKKDLAKKYKRKIKQ